MAPLNVRNNNPGNLKATDLATAKRFWGDRVQGVDGRGLGIFKDPEAGRSALEQQLKIDSSRGLNLKDFINKYVGAEADPQGTANAHQNLPKLLGVSPDTPISDIDFNKLIRAVTENEGGRDSVRHFFPDDIAAGLQAREELAPNPTMRSEVDTAGMGSNLTLDKERGIPGNANSLNTFFPFSGGKKASIDDLFSELEGSPELSQEGFGTSKDKLLPTSAATGRTIPSSQDKVSTTIDPLGGIPQAIAQNINTHRRAGSKPVIGGEIQGGGVTFPTSPDIDILSKREAVEAGQFVPSSPFDIQAGTRDSKFPTSPNIDIQTQKEAAGAGGFDLGALLKKLGGAALSNTGLTALGIGAQGIGGIMQGRAQSKADKGARRQQSTNNAIAAFMGGQAAQAAPRQANSTGGNILSALGQTLGGVANARRADQATKFDQDLETRKLDAIEVAKLQAGKQGDDEAAELQGQFDIMNKTLTELQEVHAEGGAFTTGSLAFFKLPSSLGGDRQAYLEALGNSLMGPLNSVHRLGRLSDKDIEILRKSIPTWDDGGPTVAAKVAAVRKLIEFSKTNTSKADAPPYIMSALTGGFGGTSTQPQAGGDPLGLGI